MFIKDSENGRMMLVNFTKQGLSIAYAVGKPNGQVISYSITLAKVAEGYKPVDMAIFRHNPLKTQEEPWEFATFCLANAVYDIQQSIQSLKLKE